MSLIGIDLGGTKLAMAVFSSDTELVYHGSVPLESRTGAAVGSLIAEQLQMLIKQYATKDPVDAIGICIPGINNRNDGTVWAPNIPGWEAYPLLQEIQMVVPGIPVGIDSDRICYIMGEAWKGAAQGCSDAIFMAVGTGIGAGILSDGQFLRGRQGAAGAVGWMALERPFHNKYKQCGYFESQASGDGIAKLALELLNSQTQYQSVLRDMPLSNITAASVFAAYEKNDELAVEVIRQCVELWGMAIANLVSIFNPEMIILSGGVFGPAVPLIPAIHAEAAKWAQPLSMQTVEIVPSQLKGLAGCWGAALLALQARSER